MIPVPYACKIGDRLRVDQDNPCGTDLKAGDVVTVLGLDVKVEDGFPVPVVLVSTSYGVQLLTFNVVSPMADLPTVYAAEPDELVDEFFWRILGNDEELLEWAVEARATLAANDPRTAKHGSPEPAGGGTAVADHDEAHAGPVVGQAYSYTDADGDVLEVVYYERPCSDHGVHRGFHFSINEEEEAIIPVEHIDHVLRFMIFMRKRSQE